jgi:hypothetical protein
MSNFVVIVVVIIGTTTLWVFACSKNFLQLSGSYAFVF